MPPHLTVTSDPPIFTGEGGEPSAAIEIELWNDKTAAFLDTTTAAGIVVSLLGAWDAEPFSVSGHALLDERWARVKILKYLRTPDEGATVIESSIGAGATFPFGVNATLPINDLAPQEGVRLELWIEPPGGRGLFDIRLALSIDDGQSSAPLAPFVTLASGSGIVPPDRQPNMTALIDGSEVTADGTETVIVGKGHMVAGYATLTFLDEELTLDLEDGDAVELDAAEAYRVTLSRDDEAALVVTKGPKAEAILFPDVPAGNAFVANLVVESADGVAVTVDASSVNVTARRYAGFNARAGTGLTLLVSPGDGVTDSDLRQFLSHEIPVSLTASVVNRVWRSPVGAWSVTVTDVPPTFGADLLFRVTTDGAGIVAGGIDDVRRFINRAITEWHHEVSLVEVFSVVELPASPFGWLVLYDDTEIEIISEDLSDLDGAWTSGGIKIDVLSLAPGAPITDSGTTLFTDSATDDQRPVIAFDATDLRAETRFHQVRRFERGTRLLFALVEVPAAPAAEDEHELRVAIHGRRFR